MRAVVRLTYSPRPIIAPTSQVGEVAVVRTLASYKCGWGSNNKKLTPSLTLPAGERTRVVVRLAHIPRPLKITSLRGSSHSARSNPEHITQLKTVGWVKPNNNNMDCHVAPAPRNDARPGVTPRPLWESGFADAGEGRNINRTITHPSLPSYREGMRLCRSISAFPAHDNRAYLPSWGDRSCANASELQMRVGFRQN